MMYDTYYENGVLVCNIHQTPINKAHGRFFCFKCQKTYCECCGRLRADVQWRKDTEQYECKECYQWYLEHN